MCNAWNHSASCRCGWGGDGHLGQRTYGNLTGYDGRNFFSTSRSRKVGTHDSFVVANAKCPVCKESVFFYQSEFGGRVFFDSLGWPWPKHPCTDNRLHKESRVPIEFIGEDDDHDIVRLITEFDAEGFFPLVCSRTKTPRQLGAEFLYPENSNRQNSYAHVWLRLNSELRVTLGSIFFIKEISAREGSYHLRLCYRRVGQQKISFEYVGAEIDTFIRPVLQNGRIEFKDFTGLKKRTVFTVNGDVKVKKKSNPNEPHGSNNGSRSSKEVSELKSACKFCMKSIHNSQIKAQKRACAYELTDCSKCGKKMYRHNISIHFASQCPQRNAEILPTQI